MKKELPFDFHIAEYEKWFDEHPFAFISEVEALREMMPIGEAANGIEVAAGSGRFSQALGIKHGVESAPNMRARAAQRP